MDDYSGVGTGGRVAVVCMREIARGRRTCAEREFIYTMPAVVQQYTPPFPACQTFLSGHGMFQIHSKAVCQIASIRANSSIATPLPHSYIIVHLRRNSPLRK